MADWREGGVENRSPVRAVGEGLPSPRASLILDQLRLLHTTSPFGGIRIPICQSGVQARLWAVAPLKVMTSSPDCTTVLSPDPPLKQSNGSQSSCPRSPHQRPLQLILPRGNRVGDKFENRRNKPLPSSFYRGRQVAPTSSPSKNSQNWAYTSPTSMVYLSPPSHRPLCVTVKPSVTLAALFVTRSQST